jgi:hypothetical protein
MKSEVAIKFSMRKVQRFCGLLVTGVIASTLHLAV